jgi:hypothetical protein
MDGYKQKIFIFKFKINYKINMNVNNLLFN